MSLHLIYINFKKLAFFRASTVKNLFRVKHHVMIVVALQPDNSFAMQATYTLINRGKTPSSPWYGNYALKKTSTQSKWHKFKIFTIFA